MSRVSRLTAVGWALVLVTAYRLLTLIATLLHSDSTTSIHQRNTASSVFAWWDGQWYLRIAQHGYDPGFVQSSALGRQTEAAFPPLLAALMGGTRRLFAIDYTVAGLLWGFVALVTIGVGLVRLIELDYGRRIALLTLTFLLLWPPAIFFGMLYQDGLTLAGVIWAFLLVRRRRPALAGVALAIACLGKLVVVVALIALVLDHLHVARDERRYRDLGLLVAAPIVAIVGWLVFCAIRFHHVTAALDAERAWGHGLSTPWHSFATTADLIGNVSETGYQLVLIGDFVALVALLIGVVYLALRRARPSYVIYSATMLIALSCDGHTISVGRYVLLTFPLFLAAALAVDWLSQKRTSLAVAANCAAVAVAAPAQLWLISRFARYYWAG